MRYVESKRRGCRPARRSLESVLPARIKPLKRSANRKRTVLRCPPDRKGKSGGDDDGGGVLTDLRQEKRGKSGICRRAMFEIVGGQIGVLGEF